MERGVTFPSQLAVFGQSQCTLPVGQSEQTVLVGRRGFVENEINSWMSQNFLQLNIAFGNEHEVLKVNAYTVKKLRCKATVIY